MSLKTMQWALGLRRSLQDEIEKLVGDGMLQAIDAERVINLRAQLRQVEALIVELTRLGYGDKVS